MPVSIIVTCEEQEQQLREGTTNTRPTFPAAGAERYNGEYEVIVVDMKHDKDLEEWLEEMEVHNPHLSHTFCSTTARGIDIHKLALTLGAKAANYEWLVLLPVGAKLSGEDWLSQLTTNCNDKTDVVIVKTDRKRQWNLFRRLFRPTFSLFRSTSSIILCRRSILLEGKAVRLSNCQIVNCK